MLNIVYVDPMSASNLALYDYNLLSHIDANIIYCCSAYYDSHIDRSIQYEYIFKYKHKKSPLSKFLSYCLSILKLIKIIRKERPDVVHIQWWKSWIIDFPALFLYKKYARKVIFTAHNVVPHEARGRTIQIKCAKYYEQVDRIIVHSKRTKQELIDQFRICPDKIDIIPHGILEFNLDETLIDVIRTKLLQKYNLDDKKLVFSALGRQSYYKGTDLIIKTWISSSLLYNNDRVILLVVGKGGIARDLIPETCRNIYCEDRFVSPEEFEAYLRLTDVLLLPYRKISQSGVLLTAISRHIPFVVTDVGGLSEPLEIGKVGWSIKQADEFKLQNILENLCLHPEYVDSVKKNKEAWGRVVATYEWHNAAKLTMECYKK